MLVAGCGVPCVSYYPDVPSILERNAYVWNGKDETFVVRRTSEDQWHIRVLNTLSNCMKCSMYVVRSNSEFPPTKGWKRCECTPGMDPLPTIRYVNKRAARAANKRNKKKMCT